MIKRLKSKLQSKNGGLKELLYDNIGIFIVGILIVVSIFAYGNNVKSRATSNMKNLNSLEYEDTFKGTTTSTTGN